MYFEKQGGSLIITLKGEIDHHSTMELKDRAETEFENSRAKNIIFDFSAVTFMDSAGIGFIIGRYKKAAALGGKVAVVGATGNINRVLDISGIYKLMKCYATLEDALNTIG